MRTLGCKAFWHCRCINKKLFINTAKTMSELIDLNILFVVLSISIKIKQEKEHYFLSTYFLLVYGNAAMVDACTLYSSN